MKTFLSVLFVICFIPLKVFAGDYDSARVFIQLKNGATAGTAFVVEDRVITAGHVCAAWFEGVLASDPLSEKFPLMEIQLIDGFGKFYSIAQALPVKVLFDSSFDLCELFITSGSIEKLNNLKLAKKTNIGDQVFINGYPGGLFYAITDGYIGSPYSFTKDMISCGSKGGNSGSPVLNKNGNVVGVLVAGYKFYDHASIMMNLFSLTKFLK